MNTTIGRIKHGDAVIFVKEADVNETAQAAEIALQLGINDNAVTLDLDSVRKLKKILQDGERVLVQRHHNNMLRRNLSLF